MSTNRNPLWYLCPKHGRKYYNFLNWRGSKSVTCQDWLENRICTCHLRTQAEIDKFLYGGLGDD